MGSEVRLEACEALVVSVPVDSCEVALAISDEVAAEITRRKHWFSESEFGFRPAAPDDLVADSN